MWIRVGYALAALVAMGFVFVLIVPARPAVSPCVMKSNCSGRVVVVSGVEQWRIVCDNSKDWGD